jgi:hypothetical protein
MLKAADGDHRYTLRDVAAVRRYLHSFDFVAAICHSVPPSTPVPAQATKGQEAEDSPLPCARADATFFWALQMG